MEAWKRYPFVPDWGDPAWFTFPRVDGQRADLGMASYYVDGFLRGVRSDREYAFMTIFTDMRVLAKRLRASFYTLALFDRARRRYGTYTDFDFPRLFRMRGRHKLAASPDHLALDYAADAGHARWHNVETNPGDLAPFRWHVDLPGRDHHGAAMRLTLDVDATRPPGPLGGRTLGGEMMFLGLEATYSYFQSGLRFRGHMQWDDVDEDVEGDVGWIDRQWALPDFSRQQDRRSARYRHEWRVLQLDNGWDPSCFQQWLRPAGNAPVPWSGISAQGPGPEFDLRATTQVEVTIPEFIRSPGLVRSREMLTDGPRYFPYRYRLRAPELDLDVTAEPWVDAPAHVLPIEYWTGPVSISGSMAGRPVSGRGFDERCHPRIHGWEIAHVLESSAAAHPGLDADTRTILAYRAWEVASLARRDRRVAGAHARRTLQPLLAAIPSPARGQLEAIVRDLLDVLTSRRRLP